MQTETTPQSKRENVCVGGVAQSYQDYKFFAQRAHALSLSRSAFLRQSQGWVNRVMRCVLRDLHTP